MQAKVNADAPIAIGEGISVIILSTTDVATEKSSIRKNIHATVTNIKTKILYKIRKLEVKNEYQFKFDGTLASKWTVDEKYPVIFYLHGAGSRGNNIDVIKNSVFFKLIDKHEKFPFITIAPQCSEDTWFDMFERLKKLICKMSTESFADIRRIYLMGASMGGYGTWQMAQCRPELFAAIIPICGGGMYWNAVQIKAQVWAFHGDKDPVVYPDESQKMVDAINKLFNIKS